MAKKKAKRSKVKAVKVAKASGNLFDSAMGIGDKLVARGSGFAQRQVKEHPKTAKKVKTTFFGW